MAHALLEVGELRGALRPGGLEIFRELVAEQQCIADGARSLVVGAVRRRPCIGHGSETSRTSVRLHVGESHYRDGYDRRAPGVLGRASPWPREAAARPHFASYWNVSAGASGGGGGFGLKFRTSLSVSPVIASLTSSNSVSRSEASWKLHSPEARPLKAKLRSSLSTPVVSRV